MCWQTSHDRCKTCKISTKPVCLVCELWWICVCGVWQMRDIPTTMQDSHGALCLSAGAVLHREANLFKQQRIREIDICTWLLSIWLYLSKNPFWKEQCFSRLITRFIIVPLNHIKCVLVWMFQCKLAWSKETTALGQSFQDYCQNSWNPLPALLWDVHLSSPWNFVFITL